MVKKSNHDHPTTSTMAAEEVKTSSTKTVKARKKHNFDQMGEDAMQAASGINKVSFSEMSQNEELRTQQTMPVSKIQPRPEGDTRPLRIDHLLTMTESIYDLGLLEPIVVDKEGVLLAGGHRLASYKLLSTPSGSRLEKLLELCPEGKLSDEDKDRLTSLPESSSNLFESIPVCVLPFFSKEEKERALAIETAENTQRRDYTAKEVFGIYEQLLSLGYTDRDGRPKAGEKQAKPALATILGKSIRTVRRMVNQKDEKDTKDAQIKKFQVAANRFKSSWEALRTALEELPATKEGSILEEALKLSHVMRKIKDVESALLGEGKEELLHLSEDSDEQSEQ